MPAIKLKLNNYDPGQEFHDYNLSASITVYTIIMITITYAVHLSRVWFPFSISSAH